MKREPKNYGKLALELHQKNCGKISVVSKKKLRTKTDWSTMYTPGVGAVSSWLAKKPEDARKYTIKRNTVAVISDGSAVLGLGNIGPIAALPVMEGKCAILKEKADIDGFPIVLDTQDTDEIVKTVKAISPGFGAINLEDISAPRCFEIEERLKKELNIPVMHDDQHGTAVVVLAGLINASKVVKKNIKKMKVVVIGAGAAGRAITLLLLKYGIKNVMVADSKGLICKGRKDLGVYKDDLAKKTNQKNICGDIVDVTCGADVLIGVSGPGTVKKEYIECMKEKPIVFALANPNPEIIPDKAKEAGAYIVATGRSDFPNQVNNSIAFPGIFRGALDKGVNKITNEMKLNVAKKIAGLVKSPTKNKIVPSINTPRLVETVASAIRK